MNIEQISQTYPNWHYIGFKRSILPWIFNHVDQQEIDYQSVLDLYGGTGIVSYGFLTRGKKVWYNDLLPEMTRMVEAIFRRKELLDRKIVENIFETDTVERGILTQYFDAYFTPEESHLLDNSLEKIHAIPDETLRYCLLYLLSQAVIQKQGKGTFAENTMSRRKRDNDPMSTWNLPIYNLVERARQDLNQFVLAKSKMNTHNWMDNLRISSVADTQFDRKSVDDIDLVYADPPYVAKSGGRFGNYRHNYHMLEVLADYSEFEVEKRKVNTKLVKPREDDDLLAYNKQWLQPEFLRSAFNHLLELSQDKILVLSYRKFSYLGFNQLQELLDRTFDHVSIFESVHTYDNPKDATYDDILYICH